ncbi:MAG: CotH kinase family protein [Planctomycetales bacterium]|nr:CotH kinase family protein [Planctomycetales bacterium]
MSQRGFHCRRRIPRFQRLEPRYALDASGLRITEFLASNDNTLEDFEGDSSDWLEIFNPSTSNVSLDGLYLTDDSEELTKWQFPSGVSIAAGGFLVVYASDKDLVAPNGEVHSSFKLSADGEYLGLIDVDGQTVIDEYFPEFPLQVEDVSYGLAMTSSPNVLVAEGADARAWAPTSSVHDATWTGIGFNDNSFTIQGDTGFGYENSPGGTPSYVGQYHTEVSAGTTSLYVRVPFEVESVGGVNKLTLRMKYDDGFVAYLNGVEIASANAPASPTWNSTATTFHDDFDAIQFQEFDVSAAIPSLTVGDNVLAIHALNFSEGSSDFLVVPELVVSQSSIGSPEKLGYFDNPTPGYGNGENFAGFAANPTFSVPHGFYSSPQLVELESDTPDAAILYTTDGSTPAVNENLTPTNGQIYTGPILVNGATTIRAIAFKQEYKPSFVQASSYLFLDDVIDQSPSGEAPPGWPGYNVNGQLLDYGIDPDIIALYGAQAVKESLAAIPTITLTTDLANLFDSTTGIYVNALNRGIAWERLASVELIYPDGAEGFSTNAGLRIRGGYGRNDFNPKHAFRLYFRGEYGDGMLNYPLFGEEGVDEFDVLDLRTAMNYSWGAWGDSVNGLQNTYLREVFARDTQADMGQPYTRTRYYHLYLNGQYWGLYMTQERIQEHYGESYFGGDKEDYDVVKADSTEAYTTEIADGNDAAWRQLFELAQDLADNPAGSADSYWVMQGLNPDGARNEELEVLLDVDNLIDYMMVLIYTGGYDTGISAFLGNDRANNWFGIRNRETGDQGFQFFLHDNEHSLGAGELTGSLHGTYRIDRTGPFNTPLDDDYAFFNPVYLHQDLLVHPEYVQRFVDRVQELLFNGGPLSPEANTARMMERKDQVEPAIIAEAARWGDTKRAIPYNKSDWDSEVAWLLDTYFQGRGNLVLSQVRSDGLYNQYGPPIFSQLGGEAPAGYPLELRAFEGAIYYSLDGATDPRQIGGTVNPSPEVQAYSAPIVLTQDTTVWARLREPSGAWSGLVKATFTVTGLPGDYDHNGQVDQGDYAVWRSTYGSTTDLRADGNGDLVVNAADYTVWRDALESTPPSFLLPAKSEQPATATDEYFGDYALTESTAAPSAPTAPSSSTAAPLGDLDLMLLLLDPREPAFADFDEPVATNDVATESLELAFAQQGEDANELLAPFPRLL